MGVLTVRLIKANNLKDADFIGKTDPYVKIELEQDNVVSTTIRCRFLKGQCFFAVSCNCPHVLYSLVAIHIQATARIQGCRTKIPFTFPA